MRLILDVIRNYSNKFLIRSLSSVEQGCHKALPVCSVDNPIACGKRCYEKCEPKMIKWRDADNPSWQEKYDECLTKCYNGRWPLWKILLISGIAAFVPAGLFLSMRQKEKQDSESLEDLEIDVNEFGAMCIEIDENTRQSSNTTSYLTCPWKVIIPFLAATTALILAIICYRYY